jgi:hypothetical protein
VSDDARRGPAAADEPAPSARDLVRRRRGRYRAPETGRHHHIGAAPDLQPVLGEDGPAYVGTSPVQLASRTVAQLQAQHDRLVAQMTAAAESLRFERAAALRDDVAAVTAELTRRGGS